MLKAEDPSVTTAFVELHTEETGMNPSGIDSKTFKKILSRNIALPLGMSVILCGAFIALLMILLSANRQVMHSDVVIGKMDNALKLIIDTETGLRGYLLTGKENFLEPYHGGIKRIPLEVNDLQSLLSDNPAQWKRIEQGMSLFEGWNSFAKATIESKRNGTYRIGQDSDLRKSKMDQIRGFFGEAVSEEEHLRNSRNEEASNTVHRVLLAIVILSVIAGATIAWMGRKQLLELSTSYQKALQVQTDQNLLLTRQGWIRTAQAELSQKIKGDLSAGEIAERVLQYLVNYLGASIGAVYVSEDRQMAIRMAGYALPPQSPDRFQRGEGLVGQALNSQEPARLDQLPNHYLKIMSGTGEGLPQSLLICPLLADGLAQGALELGFVAKIPDAALDLLKELSDVIGSALRSAAYRLRLQELLHESQQLTEELQTQQEELRVSNEELSERSSALQESQVRLESQHAELEQTNEQLEEQAQALERQKQDLDEQNAELEHARVDIEHKARELAAASQYKSEFLANMSHELRTPLNSSLILAKLLKDNPHGNLSDEQVEFANTIYSSGNDLLGIINDILDLSKVEAGKLDVNPEKINLNTLADNLKKIFFPMADAKKISWVVKLDAGVPEFIQSDSLRLEQILKNLLSNAIKFTASGSVELNIVKKSDRDVSFIVKDTGIGIEPSQQEIIFEAFRQADGTTNRKYGGTGLGLSISKNLAQLLGGYIEVQSQAGKGSVFTLNLPVTYGAAAAALDPTSPASFTKQAPLRALPPELPRSAVKVAATTVGTDDRALLNSTGERALLLVEDDPTFVKLMYEVAHELKFKCLVCDNTSEGFELAKKYSPSAIILDMKLSDALGLSLLDRLKSDPKTRHIPVQIVSAADYSHEALRMGAIGYAKKSHEPSVLRELLLQVDKKINQHTKSVLVVEDDSVQRMSIEKLIGTRGVQTVSVESAELALAKLQTTHFDCVIMDLSLSDMSGFELLEKISQHREFILPPIIVYTGRSLSRAEEDRLSRYSRSIILKGARSPERLLDEVTLFLHQSDAQLSAEQRKLLLGSRNREKAFDGRRILIADDDVRNIFALTSALEFKGAKVIIARNGREAVDKVMNESDIDLVLMDIMMPEMNGYEAMVEIRRDARFKKLPIIAVTAKAMRDDYERCLEAGASDYLAKPIDVDKLVSLMRVWLPKPFGALLT